MELNFSLMWEVFLKRLWAILLGFVIAAAAAFGYCEYFVTPRYKATASILVTNGALTSQSITDIKTSVSGTDIAASIQLVDTITDILQTPEVYRATAKASNGKYKYGDIVNTASIARKGENSLFVNISFTGANQKEVIKLTNLFAETSCEYIAEIIPYSKASVAAKAVAANLTYPKTYSAMAAAGVAAAVVIFVIFFLLENDNKVIKSEDDFIKRFDIPIIGAIPDFENCDNSAYTLYKRG